MKGKHEQRNMGGTHRTVELGCGFVFKGDPKRLDVQLKLHKKICEKCKESLLVIKEIAVLNGPGNTYFSDTDPSKNLKRIVHQFIE